MMHAHIGMLQALNHGKPAPEQPLRLTRSSDNPGTIQAACALAMMDKETKREMWFLAIGTALLEAPVVAIVALMVLNH